MPEVNDPDALAHLSLVARERMRTERSSLALRPLSLGAIAAFSALHAPLNPARYMFLAPALAACAWATDASLARRVAALDALGDALRGRGGAPPLRLSMDLAPYANALPLRAALWGAGRARWFLPLTFVAAAIAIDAQRFTADDTPGETVWYLSLLLVTLGALSLSAWSWWVDRFGEAVVAPAVVPALRPAAPVSFPPTPREPEAELARWTPRHDVNARPFPEAPRTVVETPARPSVEPPPPRSGSTQTFATVEAAALAPDAAKAE